MDEARVIDLIRKRAVEAGGVRALARQWGISPAYVCDLLAGRRAPGPKILRPLGLEKVKSVTYIKVHK